MSSTVQSNPAHGPGTTFLAFSRDGSCVYTGGADSLVRIWDPQLGEDQEPPSAAEAADEVTVVAAGSDCWLSGSKDGDVRRYNVLKPAPNDKPTMEGLVASAHGIPIRCIAVDPKGARVAVTSDEPDVKLVNLHDITKISILKGHTKAVRKATWHPSGSLLTTCGADGKIIVWDVSESEPKQEKVIDGIIPAIADSESPEFGHDCSVVWHTSGQYFFVATRTHDIATVARSDWTKSSTLSDDACSGAITALALSRNGVYLAAASKSGVFIWSTQNRRMLFRFQGALSAPITQMAFSPTRNLLAWTDDAGDLTRWRDPIPSSSPDPVKHSVGTTAIGVPLKRKTTPTLFDDDHVDLARTNKDKPKDDGGEDIGVELDDWIIDDLDGGLNDDDGEARRIATEGGIREMVSVTKAQGPFQPGSTPMENKKRYLVYNMIGVVEVTDQDTHHIVNVEFHDRSARKSYHFNDHFRYELAALGERGAVYACQPESSHAAHVIYKPYGVWASQSEWTYDLPTDTRVLGIAAGGMPPTGKSLREKTDVDIGGQGNVVVATSEGELIFLTGSGIERACLSLAGDFVTMVAGSEWVFVVTRDGSTTMDGAQNLVGRLIKYDDFCVLQKDMLPIPKRHTLKWVGITEEGAPAIYDSAGILNVMPRFRIPLSATWVRILDTNKLERRQGKDESYWPVGVVGDNFMCLILKGRQGHPSFPRPLIQELPIRLPFKRTDPKEAPLEEQFARETLLLDILRDGLGDELTTPDIAGRELALDKALIQLIQHACKSDRLARALDLARLLHLTPSFDAAIKIAGFYHLIGLQEKIEALKDERDDTDRLEGLREQRRQVQADFVPVPAMQPPTMRNVNGTGAAGGSRPKPFQDFRPPPALHRPGLERAAPSTQVSEDSTIFVENTQDDISAWQSSAPRKRPADDEPMRESRSPGLEVESGAKRRAVGESASAARSGPPLARSNPFARKPGAGDTSGRNPFTRNADMHKSVHKSESFFNKVGAAEADKGKRGTGGARGKPKDTGRQTTLFGLPAIHLAEKEKKAAGKKKKPFGGAGESQELSKLQDGESQTQSDTQVDVAMDDSQAETETLANDTQIDSQQTHFDTQLIDNDDEPIEWPDSPPRQQQEFAEHAEDLQ